MRTIEIKTTGGVLLYRGRFRSFTEALEKAVAEKIDLADADLSHRNLSGAALDDARLARARFTNANLSGANLSEAQLSGADFTGAALYNSCFAWSDLRHCNFEDSSFGGTDITGAQLSGSLFSTLSCFQLDFSQVQNMEGCVFKDLGGQICAMNKPPIVIQGLLPAPIVFMDQHVRIGSILRPYGKALSRAAVWGLVASHMGGSKEKLPAKAAQSA